MGIESVSGSKVNTAQVDDASHAAPVGTHQPGSDQANSVGAYDGPPIDPSTMQTVNKGFDLFQAIAALFAKQPAGDAKQQANLYDYATVLGKVADVTASAIKAKEQRDAARSDSPKDAQPSAHTPDAKTTGQQAATDGGKPKTMTSGEIHDDINGAGWGPKSFSKGPQASVSVSGSKTVGTTTFSGEAHAQAYAQAGTNSTSHFGPDGMSASVEADARIGVTAGASGSIKTEIGTIQGSASVTAEIYANAKAYVSANAKGATAGASVEVGAHVKAEATADADLAGGLVKGHANAEAEAGAGGKAGANCKVSYDPPSALVEAGAKAFAGARAAFDAKGGVAGVNWGVHGEAWAGVGAKIEATAGLENGKFRLDFGMGISLGVGTFIKFSIEIDFNAIGKAFGDLFSGIGKMFGGGQGDGSHALKSVGDAAHSLDGKSAKLPKKADVDQAEPEPGDAPDTADEAGEKPVDESTAPAETPPLQDFAAPPDASTTA